VCRIQCREVRTVDATVTRRWLWAAIWFFCRALASVWPAPAPRLGVVEWLEPKGPPSHVRPPRTRRRGDSPPEGVYTESHFGLNFRRLYAREPLGAYLPSELESDALERAAAIGIPPGARIVTLHVREPGFKTVQGVVDHDKDRSRNARVDTYHTAVDWLVGQGYTVARFGDRHMSPVDRVGVVDVATSPHNLGLLANVPCLGVNMTNVVGSYPLRPRDMYLVKPVEDLEQGRCLSLEEMLERRHFKHRWDMRRYRFVDNTSEEILSGAQEMVVTLDRGPVESAAQRRFREHVQAFLDSDFGRRRNAKPGVTEPYFLGEGRIVHAFAQARLGAAVATI
jgi:hypothetical protein